MDSIFEKFNDEEEQMKFGEDMRKYELFAVAAYIVPILFFLPIAVDKESDFCKFHSNQALCWLIVSSVLSAIGGILGMIGGPFGLIGTVIPLFMFLCEAFLAAGAWKGYAIRIPVLGNIINVFK